MRRKNQSIERASSFESFLSELDFSNLSHLSSHLKPELEFPNFLSENNFLTRTSETVQVDKKIYTVVDVLGDGNCLYRCFAYCIDNNENNHAEYRKKVVDYVFDNFEQEKERLLINRIFEDKDIRSRRYKSATNYRDAMGRTGEFGTDFEAAIFAEIYHVHLTLFRENPTTKIINKSISNELKSSDKTLNLMLRADQLSGHWVVLEDKKKDCNQVSQKSILKNLLRFPSN